MPAPDTLADLAAGLDALRDGRIAPLAFAGRARVAMVPDGELAAALSARHALVLDDLLARLESGGMAAAESCSFSQADLIDALAAWCTHARAHLARTADTLRPA